MRDGQVVTQTANALKGAIPDLFRRVIEAVTDYGIVALDRDGHVASWNRGAERLTGYTANEIEGHHFSVLFRPEDVAAGRPDALLRKAAAEGRAVHEGWQVRKDEPPFWANAVITPLHHEGGSVVGFTAVTRNMAERKTAWQELQETEEHFRLFVTNVQDYALLMLDPEGRILSWNEGAERIKGWKADEILGQSFEVFYPPEARAAGFAKRELEAAARDGRLEDEGWRLRKNGERFWANVIITPLRAPDGMLLGFAKVTRDLSARRAAEQHARQLAADAAAHAEAERQNEELRALNAQLQELTVELESALEDAASSRQEAEESAAQARAAYRDLDQFAYAASHDLKAPLRGIANLAEFIQEDAGDALPAETLEHMRLLRTRVRRMEALIDGILTYSRAGRVRGLPERVDTGVLAAEVVEALAPPPGVQVMVQPGLPTLSADRAAFQQVLLNLIGNAVKHGRVHRPDVEVRVSCTDTGDTYVFTVTDNGPGIAPEFHDRIWAVFETLQPRDKVEGTGIGLSVVKKLVERWGGRVWVESAPGQGATFGFTWPKEQEGSRE